MKRIVLVFVIVSSIIGVCRAELEIGAVGPAWEVLTGIDGKKHSLADLMDYKAVLVVFFDNTCPDCQTYLSRLVAIASDYRSKGVVTVLINVSPADSKENDLEAMRRFAKEKRITGLYLRDPSQKLGKAYDAKVTPTAYLLDHRRRLVYRGAIDDHWKPEKVQRRHLRLAIEQTLAGKKVEIPATEAQGCDIEYDQ
jgi:peroxiredoxin